MARCRSQTNLMPWKMNITAVLNHILQDSMFTKRTGTSSVKGEGLGDGRDASTATEGCSVEDD